MTEVGDVVAYFVEEELLGGGVALHPRPSLVVNLVPEGDIASLWVFGPQQMFYVADQYKCNEGQPKRMSWMPMDEWRAR